MSTQSVRTSNAPGFGGLLALTFIILKLCHVITWSWVWVLSPIWIPLAIALVVFLVVITVVGSKS